MLFKPEILILAEEKRAADPIECSSAAQAISRIEQRMPEDAADYLVSVEWPDKAVFLNGSLFFLLSMRKCSFLKSPLKLLHTS